MKAPWQAVTAPDRSMRAQAVELLGLLRVSQVRRVLLALSAMIVIVILLNAVAQVRLNAWQGHIYDAIAQRDLSVFYRQLAIFLAITVTLLVLGVAQTWGQEMLKVKLREAVSRDLLAEWLRPSRAYRLPLAGEIGSHPDQRIQDDAHRLTELTADLGVGLVQSSLLLVSFIGVLWVLSEQVVFDMDGTRFSIPGYMVWSALAYAALGSFFVWLVGRPLIKSNADLRGREGEFRFLLVRVNESAEAIAIHRGEADEERHLNEALTDVLSRMRRIANQLANLNWVTASYGWIGLLVPIVLAAPGYFSNSLTLGGLIMVVGAFYQVQQALRWYVDRFPTLAEWNAALTRVMTYREALLHPEDLGDTRTHIVYTEGPAGALTLDKLCVFGPSGRIFLSEPVLSVAPGERVLIAGTAKCGKSTYFRALAGLWIWGRGTIVLPKGETVMFMPHRPYLPLGTLREALTYPAPPGQFSDGALLAVLKRIRMEGLADALDRIERWEQELPLEEQQRLVLGRAMLHQPDWVIQDEALSEADEDNRELIQSIWRKELAGAALIGIGKAEANGSFYGRVVQLQAVPLTDEEVPAEALPTPAAQMA